MTKLTGRNIQAWYSIVLNSIFIYIACVQLKQQPARLFSHVQHKRKVVWPALRFTTHYCTIISMITGYHLLGTHFYRLSRPRGWKRHFGFIVCTGPELGNSWCVPKRHTNGLLRPRAHVLHIQNTEAKKPDGKKRVQLVTSKSVRILWRLKTFQIISRVGLEIEKYLSNATGLSETKRRASNRRRIPNGQIFNGLNGLSQTAKSSKSNTLISKIAYIVLNLQSTPQLTPYYLLNYPWTKWDEYSRVTLPSGEHAKEIQRHSRNRIIFGKHVSNDGDGSSTEGECGTPRGEDAKLCSV